MELSIEELEECLKGINHRTYHLHKLLDIREVPVRREALNRAEKIQSKLLQFFEDLQDKRYKELNNPTQIK